MTIIYIWNNFPVDCRHQPELKFPEIIKKQNIYLISLLVFKEWNFNMKLKISLNENLCSGIIASTIWALYKNKRNRNKIVLLDITCITVESVGVNTTWCVVAVDSLPSRVIGFSCSSSHMTWGSRKQNYLRPYPPPLELRGHSFCRIFFRALKKLFS